MEIKDVVSLIVTLVIAVIGVSSINIIKKRHGSNEQTTKKGNNNQVNQDIQNGNKNIQAGGNVDIKTKDWK